MEKTMKNESLTEKVRNVLNEGKNHEEENLLKEDVLSQKVRNVLTEQNPNKPSV